MKRVPWTAEQDRILRKRYPHEPTAALVEVLDHTVEQIYRRAWLRGIRKTAAYLASPAGASVATQFKPGKKPHSWRPVGSERVTCDGILQRKITDSGYPPRDWKAVHMLLWQEVHGPVPKGHIVVFKDGNRQNICLENLQLLSRAENMRRNSVHRYPPELVKLVRTRGVLMRQINKRDRREKQDQ